MTQKEKAEDLVDKYYEFHYIDYELAKKCAIIAVDEIIEANPIAFDEYENCIAKQWWQEVKTEIEKL